MNPRDVVRDELGLSRGVSRRRVIQAVGGTVAIGLSSSGASAQQGGPAEFDQIDTSDSDAAEWDFEELTGDVVGRSTPIDNLDVGYYVGETPPSTGDYLVFDDPAGPDNPNLTAVERHSGGSYVTCDNARFYQNGSVTHEFDDTDIETWQGGEWVPIPDAETAIPDAGDLHAHFDFSEYSGTSNFSDLSGNGHDLVNGSITGVGDSINGVQAGEFDGTGDTLYTDSFSDIGEFTAFAVVRLDSSSGQNCVLAFQESERTIVEWQEYDDRGWTQSTDGSFHFSDDTSPGPAVLTSVNNAGTNILRLNGSEILSYSASAGSADVIGVGSREPFSSEYYFEGAIGEARVFPDVRSSSEIDVQEQDLADKWGISLA